MPTVFSRIGQQTLMNLTSDTQRHKRHEHRRRGQLRLLHPSTYPGAGEGGNQRRSSVLPVLFVERDTGVASDKCDEDRETDDASVPSGADVHEY